MHGGYYVTHTDYFAQWLLIVVGRFIEKQLAIVPMTLQLSFFRINKKKCCSV